MNKKLDYILETLFEPIEPEETETFEYTLGIIMNLLQIPLDFSENIEPIISGIISMFHFSSKVSKTFL